MFTDHNRVMENFRMYPIDSPLYFPTDPKQGCLSNLYNKSLICTRSPDAKSSDPDKAHNTCYTSEKVKLKELIGIEVTQGELIKAPENP